MKISQKTFIDLFTITIVTILISFLIWIPHIFKLNSQEFGYGLNFNQGFNTIYRNFDGLEYVIVAKTWYNPKKIATLPQQLPDKYYASRFPLYPALILIFSPILGFLKSMLFVSLLFTIGSAIAFYFLLKNFELSKHPLWMSILFLLLPARWLIVHTIGSVEPIFIFFVICSIYFFLKFEQGGFKLLHLKNPPKQSHFIHLAAFFALLAQLTRPPGILLFISYGLYIIYKRLQEKNLNLFKIILNYHPLILIPLGLLGIFYFYSLNYGDFLAYFHSGDNIHLIFPPFQVFDKSQYWVGDIWLEDIVYIFLLGFLGGLYLIKQKLYPMAFFVLTFLGASTLIAHRDISRYLLPIFPFLLIAFEKILTSKEFKIVFVIVLLGIYLYAQNFIIKNTAPFPNLDLFN